MICKMIELAEANMFVSDHHRHHAATVGHKFSLGAFDENGWLHGVAIVGRPVCWRLDARGAWEVNRLCSTGYPRRGGKWILTYILVSEPGTSLKAAGWHRTITTPGKPWGNKNRPRVDKHPIGKRYRYEKYL